MATILPEKKFRRKYRQPEEVSIPVIKYGGLASARWSSGDLVEPHSMWHDYSIESFRKDTQNSSSYSKSPKERKSLINGTSFLLSCCLFLVLPILVLRYILSWDLTCFDEDSQNPQGHCENSEIKPGRIIYSIVTNLSYVPYLLVFTRLSLEPTGKSYKNVKWLVPLLVLYAIATAFFRPVMVSQIFAVTTVMIASILGPILDCGKCNRGGVAWITITLGQSICIVEVYPFILRNLDVTVIGDLPLIALLPLFLQANQGILISLANIVSDHGNINEFNRDAFILLAKFQMMSIQCVKYVVLFDVLKKGQFWPFLILVVTFDCLGRVQIWRLIFRRIRTIFGRKMFMKKEGKFSSLAEIMICSEVDTNYFPLLIFFLINLLSSPLNNSQFGLDHSSNSQLDLEDETLLNQSAINLVVVLTAILVVDLLSYGLYKGLHFWRLCSMKFVFMKDRVLTIICAPTVANAALIHILCLATVLNRA